MIKYIDLKYKPQSTDLICKYHAVPHGISFTELARSIAGESSIGTWTEVHTLNPTIAHQLKPTVFHLNSKKKEIIIAYPQDLFEAGNLAEILSSIAGNIYGMSAVKELRFLDVVFPEKIIKSFRGPLFGVEGVRRIARVKHRPLLGTIIKPKVGLTASQHADIAYRSWVGGLDVVKDDENLTSMRFNKFEDRMKLTFQALKKAEEKTKERKIYLPNISAETFTMLKRAELVKSLGGTHMMIDILTVGWSALQTMRNENQRLRLAIHAHRAMHGAFTRDPHMGMSMLIIAKLARMIGVDQLHIGTAHVGKMDGSIREILEIEHEVTDPIMSDAKHGFALKQNWFGKRSVFPVASGGLQPGQLPKLISRMGTDIIAQFGGGCHGHPGGTQSGATAIRQATDALLQGISLAKYAKTHTELQVALAKWQTKKKLYNY